MCEKDDFRPASKLPISGERTTARFVRGKINVYNALFNWHKNSIDSFI